jgi:hypothetical protein
LNHSSKTQQQTLGAHRRQMCFAVHHLLPHLHKRAAITKTESLIKRCFYCSSEELLLLSRLVLQSHYRCITIYNVRRGASVYSVCGLFVGSKTSLGATDMELVVHLLTITKLDYCICSSRECCAGHVR